MPATSNRPAVLVTGGARRLGMHIALGFADRGYDVAFSHNTAASSAVVRVVRALEARGARAVALQCDLRKQASVRSLVARANKQLGRIDAVVGSAGTYMNAIPLAKLTEAEFDRVVDTNLKGNFFLAQQAARVMNHGGRIVFLASLGGMRIWRDRLPYNVSKAALIALTRAAARALAPAGITVNAIAPGHIDMPGERGAAPGFGAARVPMGRFGTPNDIVEAVLFFCTSASYVTGDVLTVDGGMHLLS
jgi:3-oxoacyl-[acyl-carrier protein] reductase